MTSRAYPPPTLAEMKRRFADDMVEIGSLHYPQRKDEK